MKTLITLLLVSASLLTTGCTSNNGKPTVTMNLTVQVAPVMPNSITYSQER